VVVVSFVMVVSLVDEGTDRNAGWLPPYSRRSHQVLQALDKRRGIADD